MLPESMPGHGGYREHDILVVTEMAAENITHFPMVLSIILLQLIYKHAE